MLWVLAMLVQFEEIEQLDQFEFVLSDCVRSRYHLTSLEIVVVVVVDVVVVVSCCWCWCSCWCC